MDEKPDQIIGHIEAQRDALGRNLNELETRVRATTDWRTYYEKNPMVAVGAALGGGLLIGTMISASTHRSSGPRTHASRASAAASASGAGFATSGAGLSSGASRFSSPVTSMERRHVVETMDHVKAALIAFGIAKVKEFLNHAIPGLETHLAEAEQRGRQHSNVPSSGQSWQGQNWQSPTNATERQSSEAHSWQSAGAAQHEPTPAF